MLVSWADLIKLGVLKPHFPQVRDECSAPAQCRKTEGPNEHKVAGEGTSQSTSELASGPRQKQLHGDMYGLMHEFSDVFSDDLSGGRRMAGEMKIYLKPGPRRPCHSTTARKPPLAFKAEAKKTLKNLIDTDIIERVTTPTEWISLGHFVAKKDGKV